MSPRDSFWFLAGALVTVAIVVTLRAWLRERPALAGRPAIPSFAVPIAAALALIGVALGIYFLLGSPDSIASDHSVASQRGSALAVGSAGPSKPVADSAASAGSLDDVTRKLAARLAGSRHPIAFKKGAVCRIDVDALPPTGPGTIRWLLTPRIMTSLRR